MPKLWMDLTLPEYDRVVELYLVSLDGPELTLCMPQLF